MHIVRARADIVATKLGIMLRHMHIVNTIGNIAFAKGHAHLPIADALRLPERGIFQLPRQTPSGRKVRGRKKKEKEEEKERRISRSPEGVLTYP